VKVRQVLRNSGVTALCVLSLLLSGELSGDASVSAPDAGLYDGRSPMLLPLSDPHNKGGWMLLRPLSDEFNKTSLDTSKWKTYVAGWLGRPPALFVDHNVKVGHGTLQITMRKEAVSAEGTKLGYHDYTTSAVESRAHVLYGYFEVRAKAMKSAGSSAFWFAAKNQENWNEIDVFEAGGSLPANPSRVFMSGHVFKEDGITVNRNDTDFASVDPNVADEFHVYGVNWTPEFIDFYIDGELRRHLKNTSWHLPATMIFDAETQVDWWGMPLDSDLPSVYLVDYVRAWKQKPQTP
jgi:beta-glucanase (GH16 family)